MIPFPFFIYRYLLLFRLFLGPHARLRKTVRRTCVVKNIVETRPPHPRKYDYSSRSGRYKKRNFNVIEVNDHPRIFWWYLPSWTLVSIWYTNNWTGCSNNQKKSTFWNCKEFRGNVFFFFLGGQIFAKMNFDKFC